MDSREMTEERMGQGEKPKENANQKEHTKDSRGEMRK